MVNQRSEYIPLMTEDGPDSGAPLFEERKGAEVIRPHTSPSVLKISVALACVVSLLSLAATSLSTLTYWNIRGGGAPVDALRRPSLYIGLDRVPIIKENLRVQSAIAAARPSPTTTSTPRPTHEPGPAIGPTGPFKSFRVSSTYPDQRNPVDGWILLTEKDVTLMEFYLPVSGFTQCTFGGFFPRRRDLQDKLLTLEGDTSTIEVWDVTLAHSFNAANVTWNNKPPRGPLLGTVSAAFGTNTTTGPFRCMQGYPIMVELVCASPGCRVEFKEEDFLPRLGFEMIPQ